MKTRLNPSGKESRRWPLKWMRCGLSLLALLAPARPIGTAQNGAERTLQSVVMNRAPLSPNAFYFLPLGSVKPTGWLRRQLQIQADGLTGHLDEFWPDVGPNSGWLGGTGESWERGPYYMDGLVPLAYLLDNPKLIAKAKKWMDWTLSHQNPDGAIGPSKNNDWWPKMVMLKALTQYEEASGDSRVIPLMEKYFHYQSAQLPARPLRDWGKFRWADELMSVIWLYNRTGDKSLLELARQLGQQGYDWKGSFANFPWTEKINAKKLFANPGEGLSDVALSAHGVNHAMALKTSAVWSLVSGQPSDRGAAAEQLQILDKFHYLPNGMFSCDEHLAGHDPSQGSELCSVVEAQFSLEEMIAVLGDPALGDRLERVAYNAQPATFSKDMWAHQYDQQPNQVQCNLQQRDWTSNGAEANVFGLEPNFGCCTANMHQGWPKFVANMWMMTPDSGLAAVAYGPSSVDTTVKGGVRVQIDERTEYPFREDIHLTIRPERAAEFPLVLRIPAWAQQAAITVNSNAVSGVHAFEFYRLNRRWSKRDEVILHFSMPPRVSRAYRNSVVIERGPLVFALRLNEAWQKIAKGMQHPAPSPAADWEVSSNSPWNYGLIISNDPAAESFNVIEKPLPDSPYSPEGAPVQIKVCGRRVPDWKLVNGSAGPVPESPVTSDEPVEELTLIPYGSAKLRITAFPQAQN